MKKRAIMKQTQVMITFQIESETESELIQAINTIIAACLFLWQIYQLIKSIVTWPLTLAAGILEAVIFAYQIAGIRTRSLCWGVLNL